VIKGVARFGFSSKSAGRAVKRQSNTRRRIALWRIGHGTAVHNIVRHV